jgi:hypothetical protein
VVAAGGQCANVSGTFLDAGKYVRGVKSYYEETHLYPLLFRATPPLRPVRQIRIEQISNKVEITAIDSAQPGAVSMTDASTDCTEGWVVVKDPNYEGWINREGVVGYSDTSLALNRATDGALLVRYTEKAAGLMFIIPGAGSITRWMRFAPGAGSGSGSP